VIFIGLFIVLPAVTFGWIGRRTDSTVLTNVLEGVFRVALFLGYLLLIGRTKDIRRVFAYHGAEHKTIAAYEHDEPLVPESVDRFSTLHVRCGTNFLLLVMVITIFVFTLFGNPGLWWRIGSRILAIPVIAGIAFEMLRLGARFPRSRVIHALMVPGLWLQRCDEAAHDRPDRGGDRLVQRSPAPRAGDGRRGLSPRSAGACIAIPWV
jgi:uncharacterized protein YqhQ